MEGYFIAIPRLIEQKSIKIKDYEKTKARVIRLLKKEKKTCGFHKSILKEIIEELED